ncbi:hypothetical protein Ddc_16364 [Ditylenchus destructor]|nr:hypothetical protein Ddc_16364 [Ditylenchus destructor]
MAFNGNQPHGNQPPLNNNFAPPFAYPWYWNQEQRDMAAECARLNNELLKKESELNALNDLFHYKTNAQKYSYESKIRGLNQEIQLLKSSEQQKLPQLDKKCANLENELVKKYSELEALKSESKALALASETKYKTTCEKLEGLLLNKSQTTKLKEQNEKLEEENEMLKANRRAGVADQLSFDLDTCRVQLGCCRVDLAKMREEKNRIVAERDGLNAELMTANERIESYEEKIDKFGLKIKMQEDKCNEYVAEIENLKQDSNEQMNVELDTCKADLQKARDNTSHVTEERDRLKAQLKTANDNSETYMERIAKLELKLSPGDSANSRQLKADLELAKATIEELTIANDKLGDELNAKSADCERVSKLYNESLTSRPRNVHKVLMNFPGASSIMTAANSNTVDLNATIDLTTNDSDDEIPSSSKKKGNKYNMKCHKLYFAQF